MESFQRKSATALVVEDEALISRELAGCLGDMGLTALKADNADEAMTLLEANPHITLLLTDIRMAGSMDGLTLAYHVRRRWPTVKVIFTSGRIWTRFSDLPPGSIFIAKPYRPADIERAVSYTMGRKPTPLGGQPVLHS